VNLTDLGWNADLAATFSQSAESGLVPGRVVLEHNHVYRVLTDAGEWLAQAAGRLKFLAAGRGELPAVGDWVGLRPPQEHQQAVIRLILPRRSCFSRKAAGRETEEQVVAANIDYVFLVSSLDAPPKLRSVERYLVLARHSGAQPVVLLNKADLADDLGGFASAVVTVAPEVPVHAISARDGRGFEWLEPYLTAGRTIALLGPSGAGKSSIINRLVGHQLLATGEVRDWDARGRHTTVHRQLIVLDRGGVLIDTPGMRELQVWDTNEGLEEIFSDVDVLAVSCRFRDCRHDQEPGCAVKAAVEAGSLDAARYGSYIQLAHEREAVEAQQAERALLEKKRQGKIGAKSYRALQKRRGH
jgi:ribosome biogenesis GTPase / thiamine phosphate phosphatase